MGTYRGESAKKSSRQIHYGKADKPTACGMHSDEGPSDDGVTKKAAKVTCRDCLDALSESR